MAIQIAIRHDENERKYQVWAMLDDPDFNADPTERGESFIVGMGKTVEDALNDAERELDRASGIVSVLRHDARLGLTLGSAMVQAVRRS